MPFALGRSQILYPGAIQKVSVQDFVVPGGLVGYWGFDVDCWKPADGIAVDLAGNNDVAKVSSIPAWVDGQVMGAINIAGQGSKSLILGSAPSNPLPNLPQGAAAISLSCWTKLNATSSVAQHFGSGPGNSSGNRLSFFTDGTGIGVEFGGTGKMATWTQDLFWHFLCFTYPGGNIKNNSRFYMDGLFKTPNYLDDANVTLNNDFSKLFIGNGQASLPLNGLIDECRIYNRVLDDGEIMTLYQAGLCKRRYNNFNQRLEIAASITRSWLLYFSRNAGTYEPVTTTSVGVKSADASSDADETKILIPRL